MKICIYDKMIPRPTLEKLKSRGFLLIETMKLENFDSPLATHPDIQVCKLKDNEIVVEPSIYKYYKECLSKYGIIIHKGFKKVESEYPKDSHYNLACNGRVAIHNFEITDAKILDLLEINNIKRVPVKQGYSKCNIVFTKSGIITSDRGIFGKLDDEYQKLLVNSGHVLLEGFQYGFLGGASGLSDKIIYFLGDIKLHPDYEKIKAFLDRENTEIEILGEGPLMDFGSLIFLENEEE